MLGILSKIEFVGQVFSLFFWFSEWFSHWLPGHYAIYIVARHQAEKNGKQNAIKHEKHLNTHEIKLQYCMGINEEFI